MVKEWKEYSRPVKLIKICPRLRHIQNAMESLNESEGIVYLIVPFANNK